MILLIIKILLVLVLIQIISYIYKHYKLVQKYKHIPGEISILPFMLQKELSWHLNPWNMKKLAKKHGVVFKIITGTEVWIITSDPSTYKEIFITKKKYFDKNPHLDRGTKYLYKKSSLFSSFGEGWKRQYSICHPVFLPQSLEGIYVEFILPIVKDIVKKLSTKLEEKKEVLVDLESESVGLTFDVISTAGFGVDLNNRKNSGIEPGSILESSLDAFNFQALAFSFSPFLLKLGGYLPFKSVKKVYKNVEVWKNFITDVVNKRKAMEEKECEKKNDLLSRFIFAKTKEGDKFDDDELISNTSLFLSAGYETTGAILQWVLYYIAKYPKVQEKILKELKSFDNSDIQKKDSFSIIEKNHPYLMAVFNEAFRLKNPAHFDLRHCIKKTTLGPKGYEIYKGTGIINLFRTVCLSEDHWENPEEFNPDRFMGKKIDPLVFSPFGLGPRQCIGQRMAVMEVVGTCIAVVRDFEIGLDPEYEKTCNTEDVTVEFTLKPLNKLKVLMKKRNYN